ncbi:MAG: glutamate--tRNA ligase [Mycoplasmataceae bacterium]|nr:glutamate--tRNA ligase [Mycoplasmataceae bacterium]
MTIRTRYAPSPTGFFHIGGARTALFNYLFAKNNGGQFIVRIEDTDVSRNVEGAIDAQLNGLEWLGISPDESIRHAGNHGPYIQSEMFEKFRQIGEQLVTEGKAYYCFCTPEELEKQREEALAHNATPKYNRKCTYLSKEEIQAKLDAKTPYSIRLRIPDNKTYSWNDIIRGSISVPSDSMSDPVIVKSNGIPTYNFAVVLDDHRMEITHVLRGEEHISNTPYQMAIMEALGYNPSDITYGHLSIIVDDTGKKLSKRNLTLKQFIEDYQKLGYVGEAVTNFIALLGWSSSSNNEIFSIPELVKEFDIKRISKAPSFFDIKKMDWVSGEYFKKMDEQKYLAFAKQFVEPEFLSNNKIDELLLAFKNQISYAAQLNNLIKDNFMSYDENEIVNILNRNEISINDFKTVISAFKQALIDAQEINLANANAIVEQVKQTTGMKGKLLFMPLRLIMIGKEHGIEMNKILSIVDKQTIINNIDNFNNK